jgi:cytochrome c553
MKTKHLYLTAIAAILIAMTGFAQKPEKGSAVSIPDNISSILEKSCYPCHTAPGNKLALMKLNFEKWGEYDAKKQQKKSGKMCSYVKKGKMPPKKFVTENPDKAPKSQDIQAICDWAASYKK